MAEEIKVVIVGEQGPSGRGVPTAGTTGQYLRKASDGNFDTEWTDSTTTIPGIGDVNDVVITTPTTGDGLVFDGTNWVNDSISSEGTINHSELIGLELDDHPQYLTDERGDAKYFTKLEVSTSIDAKADQIHTHTEDEIIDLDKYTQAQVDSLLSEYASRTHTHIKSDISDFDDSDYATKVQGALSDSATQPGDDISTLNNDAGYVTTNTSDHAQLDNIGSNTHDQIDGHIADNLVHFEQDAISITKSQISDFNDSDYITSNEDTAQTTGTTPKVLTTISIPNGQQRILIVGVRGHEPATNDASWHYIRFAAKTQSGVTSIIGGVAKDTGYDSNAADWKVGADTNAQEITIVVTGEASKTINWTANVEIK